MSLQQKNQKRSESKVQFAVSVVIPAYNEEKTISKCLRSLHLQTTKKSFEVILVDNNSKDETIKTAEKFTDKLNLRIVSEKKQGRGAARARGFDEAKGDIIFTTDADTITFPEWIELYTSFFRDKNVVAVTGPAKIIDNTRFNNWFHEVFSPAAMTVHRWIYDHYWLNGFSFAIRRSAYQKAGGLNRNLNVLDDIELGFRVAKIGKISYLKNPRVTFSGRRFQKNFYKEFFSYGKLYFMLRYLRRTNISLDDIR